MSWLLRMSLSYFLLFLPENSFFYLMTSSKVIFWIIYFHHLLVSCLKIWIANLFFMMESTITLDSSQLIAMKSSSYWEVDLANLLIWITAINDVTLNISNCKLLSFQFFFSFEAIIFILQIKLLQGSFWSI